MMGLREYFEGHLGLGNSALNPEKGMGVNTETEEGGILKDGSK
jgi:hypothetical protein